MDKMEEVCHNCMSKDIFFDGELYKCIKCHYQWLPEVHPVSMQVNRTDSGLPEGKKEEFYSNLSTGQSI